MASIRCANCKATHNSVEEVKTCFGLSGKLPGVELPKPVSPADFSIKSATIALPAPASEKQVSLMKTLMAERDLHNTAYPSWHDGVFATITKPQASACIKQLLELPKLAPKVEAEVIDINARLHPSNEGITSGKAAQAVDEIAVAAAALPQLRKMHYAIEERDYEKGEGEPVWKFYRVDLPTKGKWAGRIFLDIQASDDYYPVRDSARKLNVLHAIGFNPEKAASDYGHQIGRCGICRRTLTDPISIDRGIGPVCAKKAGW